MLPTEHAKLAHQEFPATLSRYHPVIEAAARQVARQREDTGPGGIPFRVAEPSGLDDFYAASAISVHDLSPLGGRRLTALNLMRNPGTRTTKTFASLSMVARAVQHTAATGEPIMIVTPSSGNKGTALRDAVARAYATGLADPDTLRVLTVTPWDSLHKLRDGPLSDSPELRRANPAVVAKVGVPAAVKELARAVADDYLASRRPTDRWRPWYTLDLDNYRIADVVRACVLAESGISQIGSPAPWHVHAVSSAYGLLGYSLGHRLLQTEAAGLLPPLGPHPGFFLVQHLATADMVLSLTGAELPSYRVDAEGSLRQDADPRFPQLTDSLHDCIDSTFYTKQPVTSASINPLIARHGGGGVVVSRRECLERYRQVCELAEPLDAQLPQDPERLREWSLVMALTGLLIAEERQLLPPQVDLVVHASGCYTDETLPAMPAGAVEFADSVEEVRAVLRAALD